MGTRRRTLPQGEGSVGGHPQGQVRGLLGLRGPRAQRQPLAGRAGWQGSAQPGGT